MDKTETVKVLAVLKAAYPHFYRQMGRDQAEATLRLWQDMFSTEPYELVMAAVKTYIASSETDFPPAIGKIKSNIRLLTEEPQMTPAEAWNLVVKAIRTGDKVKSFYALPEIIQKCVGSPSTLMDWGMSDIGDFQTIISAQFRRSFVAKQEAENKYKAIPDSVKKALPNMQNLFRIAAPEESD